MIYNAPGKGWRTSTSTRSPSAGPPRRSIRMAIIMIAIIIVAIIMIAIIIIAIIIMAIIRGLCLPSGVHK